MLEEEKEVKSQTMTPPTLPAKQHVHLQMNSILTKRRVPEHIGSSPLIKVPDSN